VIPARRGGFFPAKHLDRYRHIASVLADEGLHTAIDTLGLSRVAPARRNGAGASDGLTVEQHIRRAIERLGVTFIKGGQALSTRTDIVPPALAAELRKLQDEVTPEPFEIMRAVVEQDLGQPIESAFASFESEPFASASIGQVHRAELADGTCVAVKIQRLGVREQVEIDLDITLTQAQWVARHMSDTSDLDVMSIVTEFADAVRGDLDYVREARNAER
jgi:ubiquinone biosynthesis protein